MHGIILNTARKEASAKNQRVLLHVGEGDSMPHHKIPVARPRIIVLEPGKLAEHFFPWKGVN